MFRILSSSALLKAAAILGATGVALGAFGGHGLKKMGRNSANIETWNTAVKYQLIHAVAILSSSRTNNLAGTLMLYGTLCFSGSLYLLTLKREWFRFLGPVTPIGGLLFIGGWLALLL